LRHKLSSTIASDAPRLGIRSKVTYRYGLGGRIDGCDNTKHAQSDVCSLLFPSTRTCFVMKHRRVNVTKRYAIRGGKVSPGCPFYAGIAQHVPRETPHERDELVKVLRAGPADCCAAHDNKESERVLSPLDIPVQLPTSSKETILHDPHSREQLEWHGKQNRERIEELHGLCEA